MIFNYLDAFFYSLMVGAGEAYFAAYALKLGFSELQAGLITTVPIVIAGLIQVLSHYGINTVKSFKKWTLYCVFLQSMTFLLLAFGESLIHSNYLILFLIVTFYWSIGLSITPGWNSWISSLMEGENVRRFFSTRNTILAIGTLSGLILSGLTLQFSSDSIFGVDKFKFLFMVCFTFRITSFLTLTKVKDVLFVPVKNMRSNFRKMNNFDNDYFIIRFIVFSGLIKLGVYFSASFFSPYMLKQLNLSYLEYMLILASAYSGRAILGKLIKPYLENYNINRIYFWASMGIGLIPILWILSKSFYYILVLEIFTGVLWGAFEIAFFVTCFEEIKVEKQATYMSLYNLLHTVFIGIGCLSGAFLFYYLGSEINSYYIIFFISGLLRLLSLLIFPKKDISVVFTEDIIPANRLYAVRPNMGMVGKVMWPVMKLFKKEDPKD